MNWRAKRKPRGSSIHNCRRIPCPFSVYSCCRVSVGGESQVKAKLWSAVAVACSPVQLEPKDGSIGAPMPTDERKTALRRACLAYHEWRVAGVSHQEAHQAAVAAGRQGSSAQGTLSLGEMALNSIDIGSTQDAWHTRAHLQVGGDAGAVLLYVFFTRQRFDTANVCAGEHLRRQLQAECPCGLKIDRKLKLSPASGLASIRTRGSPALDHTRASYHDYAHLCHVSAMH
jgi:hypothetical protein